MLDNYNSSHITVSMTKNYNFKSLCRKAKIEENSPSEVFDEILIYKLKANRPFHFPNKNKSVDINFDEIKKTNEYQGLIEKSYFDVFISNEKKFKDYLLMIDQFNEFLFFVHNKRFKEFFDSFNY